MEPQIEVYIEAIGQGIHRYEFLKDDNVSLIPKSNPNAFCLVAWDMSIETLRHFHVTFLEFAARHEDCDGHFVRCVQFANNGSPEEKLLHVKDFVIEVFNPSDDPYFTYEQCKEYRKGIENTLLNIIDGRA